MLGRLDNIPSEEYIGWSVGRSVDGLFGCCVFDPWRVAILLVGGDKTGDRQFYERFIPITDEHLVEIGASGSGDGDDGSSCFLPASGETVAGGSG